MKKVKIDNGRDELKASFKDLQQLIDNFNNAISLGIIKIEQNKVYLFKEVWDSWDEQAKNAFSKNIIAFFKVKFNVDLELNIYIKDIETNEEFGFIATDIIELIESI